MIIQNIDTEDPSNTLKLVVEIMMLQHFFFFSFNFIYKLFKEYPKLTLLHLIRQIIFFI